MARGGMRGGRGRRGGVRGGPGGVGGGGPHPHHPRLSPRPPFDLTLAEPAFPRCTPLPADTAFTQALLKRHTELCPSPAEQAAVLNLVTKIETVVENLAVVPGDFASFQLLMVRHIGAFKQGTMLKGDNSADLVFILKTLPTKEAVEGLSNKVTEELKNLLKGEAGFKPEQIKMATNEHGFSISNGEASVRVFVSTINHNLRKLKPEVHLPYEVLRGHMVAINHTMWFEENAHHSSVKVLVRLLKDLCARHAGLSPLKPWLLDILSHHAIMNNPSRQALPLNQAYRRALQLLSSGLYLPGSTGAVAAMRGSPPSPSALTHAQLDRATMTAQTLLRVLAKGGHSYLLGLQEFEDGKDISCEITVWDGVVVSPLAPAYEPNEKSTGSDGDDYLYAAMDEGDEGSGTTQEA